MADLPISGLPSAGALSGSEPLAIVQAGATKQTTVQDVANLAGGSLTPDELDAIQGSSLPSSSNVFITEDAQTFTKDANDNVFYNGVTPTLGTSCGENIFYRTTNNCILGNSCAQNTFYQSADFIVLGNSCYGNTFEQLTREIIFGDNLRQTLVRSGNYSSLDLTASPTFDFLYSRDYNSEIYIGLDLQPYHRYYDGANNRDVITLLVSPYTVSYIGSSGSTLDLEVNGTPNGDQTLLNLIEGTNIDIADNGTGGVTITSLADRYKTTSLSSILIGNGSRTFTVDANLAYISLQEVLIVYDASNHMHGTVTSYSGTTLVVDVKNHTGSGTYASWSINLDGTPVDGITGVGVANRLAYFTSAQVIDDAAAITAARALISDANGIPTHSATTSIELGYVSGVSSAIQTQLDAKTDTITSFVLVGTWTTPADAATTYVPIWGNITTPLGTITTLLTSLPYANRVIGILVQHFNNTGTQGTNENFAIRLRNNTTSTSTQLINIQTNQASGVIKNFNASGLTVDSAANDELAIEFLAPTWATNPTNLQLRIVLFIQKI